MRKINIYIKEKIYNYFIMPEGPEVRIFADFILQQTMNKDIIGLNIISGRYKKKPETFIKHDEFIKHLPTKIKNIGVKGKFMYIEFTNGFILFVTLGLMGGWSFNTKGNIEFLTNDGTLVFNDKISNGTLQFVKSTDEIMNKLSKIGYDIMDPATTFDIFKTQLLKKNKQKIGIALVDQKVISGIGNYLRAEILYSVKINPFTCVKDIPNLQELYDECKKMSLIHYQNPNHPYIVYNQKTDSLGNAVKKEILGGTKNKPRYIHWVSNIQK